CYQVVGELVGDFVRGGGPGRVEPSRDPVESAQDSEGEQLRVARCKRPVLDSRLHDTADAAIKQVTSGDDCLEVRRRQGLEIHEERRTMELVEDHVHAAENQLPQFAVRVEVALLDVCEQLEQEIQRILVAGKENLLFVPEVVVEI